MHKKLLAFIAALLIATTPIFADTTSTDSSATVTASEDVRWALKEEKEEAQYRKDRAEFRKQEVKCFKAMAAFFTLLGAGAMAHGYGHYKAVTELYNPASPHTYFNLSVVEEQYKALGNLLGGATITVMGLLGYALISHPSSDEQS